MAAFHILCILLTGAVVLYSDFRSVRWLLARKETLSLKTTEVLHALVGIGLAGMILTGGLMFVNRLFLLHQTVFIIKMLFVLALVVNGFFISKLAELASHSSFAALDAKQKARVLFAGGISIAGWVGATVCGLILGGYFS